MSVGRRAGRPGKRSPLSGHSRVGAGRSTAPTRWRLLEAQNLTREPDLVPVRHGRMMVSPFTFYRGAAKIMATDLKDTPTAGLNVQLCGDAHLSNFGVFASPERALLFDLNDFDETLPGPFEYDVKRMAASFTIAARNNGFTKADTQRRHPGLGDGLPGGHGRVRGHGQHGDLVRPPVRAGHHERHPLPGQRERGPRRRQRRPSRARRAPARPPRRRTPATACRRCRSSASWSTVATGS